MYDPQVSNKDDHRVYDYTKSSSCLNYGTKTPCGQKQTSSESFNITYGDGSGYFGASGYVVTDLVTVGATPVINMGVDVATKVGQLSDDPPDGILGLAFGGLNSGNISSCRLRARR